MTEQNGGDAIDRALARAGVRPGSALEADVRASIYSIVGTAADAAESARKLDRYLAAQRSNPLYADSLLAPSQTPQAEKTQPLDLLNLSREEFNNIVAGKTQVGR